MGQVTSSQRSRKGFLASPAAAAAMTASPRLESFKKFLSFSDSTLGESPLAKHKTGANKVGSFVEFAQRKKKRL